MKFKRVAVFVVSAVMLVGALSGCDFGAAETEKTGEVFSFVAKDTENPYMQKVYEGFERACDEAGITARYDGPSGSADGGQAEIIDGLIESGVDAVAVAANDADALEAELKKAMDAGIKVISLDSAVNADARITHIQQADPEKIGRGLIQAAYKMVDGCGGIAVLTTTEQTTNQNLWIDYMRAELEENAEKYALTPLITIAYGGDDLSRSEEEAEKLLDNPDVDVIVSPTVIGLLAAARVIDARDSSVKLTGLGLPSQMAEYIESGVCEWMYLWNPDEIGYLAGCTLTALVNGEITGAVGESFKAGKLGTKTVTEAADGGTEIMLGEPYKFDKSNIEEWKNVY